MKICLDWRMGGNLLLFLLQNYCISSRFFMAAQRMSQMCQHEVFTLFLGVCLLIWLIQKISKKVRAQQLIPIFPSFPISQGHLLSMLEVILILNTLLKLINIFLKFFTSMQSHSDPCLQHTFELELKNQETQLSKTPSAVSRKQVKTAVQASVELLTSELASFNQEFNRLNENFHMLTRLTYLVKPQFGGMEGEESTQKKQIRTFRPIVLQSHDNKSFVY